MNSNTVGPFAGLALLVTRGVLLWIVIPIGFIAWSLSVAWSRHSLGQFLGWVDLNLVWILERTLLRPLFPRPSQGRVRANDISKVTHRVGALDPA